MDGHAAETEEQPRKPEDLRVFLALGLPIFVITLSLATLVVFWGPGHGQ
ncbi:MAG: hypothetical protein Q7S25_04880 [Candidatus Limnocylindria bacterium]|nr:hypothetical protein [Candidatus Limnocylindria bacterium]